MKKLLALALTVPFVLFAEHDVTIPPPLVPHRAPAHVTKSLFVPHTSEEGARTVDAVIGRQVAAAEAVPEAAAPEWLEEMVDERMQLVQLAAVELVEEHPHVALFVTDAGMMLPADDLDEDIVAVPSTAVTMSALDDAVSPTVAMLRKDGTVTAPTADESKALVKFKKDAEKAARKAMKVELKAKHAKVAEPIEALVTNLTGNVDVDAKEVRKALRRAMRRANTVTEDDVEGTRKGELKAYRDEQKEVRKRKSDARKAVLDALQGEELALYRRQTEAKAFWKLYDTATNKHVQAVSNWTNYHVMVDGKWIQKSRLKTGVTASKPSKTPEELEQAALELEFRKLSTGTYKKTKRTRKAR